MNIKERIKNKIQYLRTELYVRKKKVELQKILQSPSKSNTIYFFCTPTHSNLGDQAQLLSWLRLFAVWYPDYEVVCVPTRYRSFSTLRDIHKRIRPDDLIFIHSGYLIFDPHPELPFILDVVKAFYDRKVVILPQTVNLVDEWFQSLVARTFNAHDNLTLFCRDEVSLEKATRLFPNVTLRLMPDVVTSLIGSKDFSYSGQKRNGIMICVRNDGEKLYSDDEIGQLRLKFKSVYTEMCDTTIDAPIWEWDTKGEALIREMLQLFSRFQVIITDRYHGTIFSQIVNTPVIVLSSTDHKLSSGVKWFPKELFAENISFAKNLDKAYAMAVEILKRNGKELVNPPYFCEQYYSNKL